MAFQNLPGGPLVQIGAGIHMTAGAPSALSCLCDAVNEACIQIGRIVTEDGASHTIDTTGSSALEWRNGSVAFADAGTTVKVGLAAVDTANGPPGRASNTTDVINFDVAAVLTGGGGGITSSAWISSVPTTGTKTIANGDLVAFAVQMTARGATDQINPQTMNAVSNISRPQVTNFQGASYSVSSSVPNAIIVFSDGTRGYFFGGEVFSSTQFHTFNSGSATKEYGQLFKLPFPVRIYGAYGWYQPSADCDVVLYSSPLGTPVAEKTVSLDANTVSVNATRKFVELFSSPYDATPNQELVVAFKPGASNVTTAGKVLGNAGCRVADPYGTSGYGVSRATGAFSNINSSLEHTYIGLIVGGFNHPARPSLMLGI